MLSFLYWLFRDALFFFGSIAGRCIENEILMLLRTSKKRKGDISLSEPIGTDNEGNDISFPDILGTPPDAAGEEAVRRIFLSDIRRLAAKLPGNERTVIALRYGLMDGRAHPQHGVASVPGISRSYVSRIEKRAPERLRQELGEPCQIPDLPL